MALAGAGLLAGRDTFRRLVGDSSLFPFPDVPGTPGPPVYRRDCPKITLHITHLKDAP